MPVVSIHSSILYDIIVADIVSVFYFISIIVTFITMPLFGNI